MRLDYQSMAPEVVERLQSLARYRSSLDKKLIGLIDLRASQLNGCAFCMHLHTLQLKDLGETDIRLDCLAAWEETDLFTPRERAALAWTEALTNLSQTHAPDDVYEIARQEFSDQELVDLTYAITTINAWNRFGVGFRMNPSLAPMLLRGQLAAR